MDAWCIFRNLAHTVYREIRHLGPQGDPEAHCVVVDEPFLPAAKLCRRNRAVLKGITIFRQTASATAVSDILQPYIDRTSIQPPDLVKAFEDLSWQPNYGGPKWAIIAKALLDLIAALEDGDSNRSQEAARSVFDLCHNSGKLVPTSEAWERDPWQQEKWPLLCE